VTRVDRPGHQQRRRGYTSNCMYIDLFDDRSIVDRLLPGASILAKMTLTWSVMTSIINDRLYIAHVLTGQSHVRRKYGRYLWLWQISIVGYLRYRSDQGLTHWGLFRPGHSKMSSSVTCLIEKYFIMTPNDQWQPSTGPGATWNSRFWTVQFLPIYADINCHVTCGHTKPPIDQTNNYVRLSHAHC
jgi:hypothetical protein